MMPRSRSGFTLAELLVAIVIISGGLLATAATMGRLIRLQRDQTVRTEMTMVAKNKLEELRFRGATGFRGGIQAGGTINLANPPIGAAVGFWDTVTRAGGRSYYRFWSISAVSVPSGTLEVSVRVTEVSRASRVPIEVTLTTYLPSGA